MTRRQKITLEAIECFINENGYSPTYRELCQMLKVTSTETVFSLVMKLEKKGYIKTTNGKARTIRVLKGLENE